MAHSQEYVEEIIDESYLRFRFTREHWQVIKWDEHPAHLKGMQKCQGSKAVDFVALHRTKGLYFIEVKDHRKVTRDKSKPPLGLELARKVRDTIAGLIGGARQEQHASDLLPYARYLTQSGNPISIVLWEEPFNRASLLVPADTAKKYLRWLTPKVLVVRRARNIIPNLRVDSLAGAGPHTP